ncbi:MAG: hypothetical protein ACTHN4_03975 [Sphingomicrobium sp.]
MSAPIRFLALVLAGWAGIRAVTLGAVPGFTVSFAKERPASALPPIVPTQFPPLPPVHAPAELWAQQPPGFYPQYPPLAVPAGYYLPYRSPAYAYPAAAQGELSPIPPRPAWQLPSSGARSLAFAESSPRLADWDISGLPALPSAQSRPLPVFPTQPVVAPRLDRLQLTTWALLRGPSNPGTLASGGTLGGSQAGVRLSYNFNRWLAASFRTTSPVGGSRGAEVAGGLRVTPFRSIPIAITAERRQSISRDGGGRSAFALFAEGGLYHQPMPLDFGLDAYFQAGVVGFNSRDLFADGAMAFTRPVWGRVSAGFGLWGGAQPGVYRIDAGPRISVRLRDNIYAHIDWRQRLAGQASPSSGPALTVAADF